MLFKIRLVKKDALLSLTKLLNRCLGRSRLYFSEDSLDPNLCGIKTNRVNIFLAASIPGLNISKHVKLTFLHRSRQGSCRLQLPKNPGELALGGAPSAKAGSAGRSRPESTVSQLCHSAWQKELVPEQVCYLLISTDTLSTDALFLIFAPWASISAISLVPVCREVPSTCSGKNLRFLSSIFTVYSIFQLPHFCLHLSSSQLWKQVLPLKNLATVPADFLSISLVFENYVFSSKCSWSSLRKRKQRIAIEYDAISLDHVASWELALKMSQHNDKDSALLFKKIIPFVIADSKFSNCHNKFSLIELN